MRRDHARRLLDLRDFGATTLLAFLEDLVAWPARRRTIRTVGLLLLALHHPRRLPGSGLRRRGLSWTLCVTPPRVARPKPCLMPMSSGLFECSCISA